MTRHATCTFAAFVCLIFVAARAEGQPFRPRPAPLSETMAADAALRDLAMIDAQHGWAVGDRGVVLFTEDGGRRWLRQDTPTTASLAGVSFVDSQHGWTVGGVTTPYTHSTRGVVLYTSNGGYSWTELPGALLPALRGVRFFDRKQGVAWGEGGPLAPSGMFRTRDGGRHWETVHADEPASWHAAALLGERAGVVVGGNGAIAEYSGGSLERLRAGNQPNYRAVTLSADGLGAVAGDGLLLVTRNGGQRWTPTPFPTDFDTRGLAQHKSNLWAIGAPGAAVLQSSDGGATWQAQPTSIRCALNAVRFVDARNGWAVGELGTILATSDAGATWRIQRQGGQRCAALVLSPMPEDLPLELVAKLGAGEGYLTAAVAVFANPTGNAAERDRFRQAAIGAGATVSEVATRFPLTPSQRGASAQVLTERLEEQLEGAALSALQDYLALLLDRHQPDVVMIAASRYRGAGQLLESALMQTLDRPGAASTWRPRRVLRQQADPGVAPTAVTTTDFVPQLNTSLQNWAAPYQGLLTQQPQPNIVGLAWSPLSGGAPIGDRGDPLAGLVIEHGGPARRAQSLPPDSGLAALKALAIKNQERTALLSLTSPGPNWADLTIRLTGGLDEGTGAKLLTDLAAAYQRRGSNQMSVDTSYLLARRYPGHPLSEYALRRLVQHYASSERALCSSQGRTATLDPSLTSEPTTAETNASLDLNEHLDRALKLGQYLEQAMPTLHADPRVAFSLAAACRLLDQQDRATTLLTSFKRNVAQADWRRCAELEEWLAERGRPAPKPTLTLKNTAERPMLDGSLDESFWQTAETAELLDTNRPDKAIVRIAYDDQFLYLAIEAQKLPGAAYPTDNSARPRDADLRGYDRVSLRLDTNRDYATSLELTVDCRGWTHDRCDDDPSWNPRWYVASQASEDRWRIEAAIPLEELCLTAPTAGDAWAVSLERQAPGRLPRYWTAPFADGSPDAFGVVLFEEASTMVPAQPSGPSKQSPPRLSSRPTP